MTLFSYFCASELCGEDFDLSFLAVADPQYATYAPKMGREYELSIDKLNTVRGEVEASDYAFTVNLGDLVDSKFENIDAPLRALKSFGDPLFNVLGNHDFEMSKDETVQMINLLCAGKPYYSFDSKGWRFIVLDASRLSPYSKVNTPELKAEYEAMFAKLKSEKSPNAVSYNGGIDSQQMQWLRDELKKAADESKKVIVFCHIPILPFGNHSLYNSDEVKKLLLDNKCVKAYINGHHHKGGYAQEGGLHFITIYGLVEGKDVSYAKIRLSEDKLKIDGVGKVKSLDLDLR